MKQKVEKKEEKPPECSWKLNKLNNIEKIFRFKEKDKLSQFVVGILFIEHNPGDPIVKATEKINKKDMEVEIEVISASEEDISYTIKKIEFLYGRN